MSVGHRVVGLATSEAATGVLAEEGVPARNVTRWLAAQARLEQGRPLSGDEAWQLAADDFMIVDEAAMTTTSDLVAVHQRCQDAGAKLLLVGDPRQLAAVGPGGALADVAERGVRYELAEVRRFAAGWEGPASLALRDSDPALDEYQRHGRLVDGGTGEQAEVAAARGWLADTLAGRESLLLVTSNEAADRACALLRAELVALGRVAEHGVPLDRQGTVAGVGDLVQARRNGWELIGHAGNTAAPINRQTYRVTATHDDGGLTVAAVHGRDPGGTELHGPTLHLPSGYVAADLTLGYACTVHAAQGRTVATAHAVIAPGSDAAGAYVALTRGRDRNTAYAVTTAVSADAPTGQTHEVVTRTARAVLADLLERAERERSALAVAEESARDAASTRTHGDRLIEGISDATAGRTAALLDRLAAAGTLSLLDRQRLAADDGIGAIDRLLRTAEVAGRDPGAVLREAVAARDFRDARSPAQVLYARIDSALAGRRSPTVGGYADLIPPGITGDQQQFLLNRAQDADQRRRELGAETAERPPQWAREALGPVPDDPAARAAWEQAAGWAASWRELADHTDDADPLGPAPPAGLVEKRAIWRTAHEALRLPDRGGDEHECSDGQLRARVRAMTREEAWAPRYVGDELDATEHAAQQARADARLWAAHADAAADPDDEARLRADAAAAAKRAEELAERAAQLAEADTARASWYAATAGTRDAAARALGELHTRGVDPDEPAELVTAEEWLAAHRAEQAAEDPHRQIGEADLHDPARDPEHAADGLAGEVVPAVETAVSDVRDVQRPGPTEHAEPAARRRVPTVDETVAAVARAQTALAEIAARRVADQAREDDDAAARSDQLTHWAQDDQATAEHDTAANADDAMELQQ